jgi:hypothetical protein
MPSSHLKRLDSSTAVFKGTALKKFDGFEAISLMTWATCSKAEKRWKYFLPFLPNAMNAELTAPAVGKNPVGLCVPFLG